MSVDNLPPHLEEEVMETISIPAAVTYEPFPLDALPEPIARYVEAAAKSICCDPAYVALPLLSVLASAVGNSMRLVVKKSWHAPCCIWTLVVGDSGTAKTPAFKKATMPADKLQDCLVKQYKKDSERYEREHNEYLAKQKEYDKRKVKGLALPVEPTKPTLKRIKVLDATIESLAPILKENPRGLLLAPNELSGWLGSFNRYNGGKGADEAAYLSMFDGDQLIVDRKMQGTIPIYVSSALVSITGNIQPDILATMMTADHRASGLSARFLFAEPPKIQTKWNEEEVSDEIQDQLLQIYAGLIDKEMQFVDGGLEPHYVGLGIDAKKIWVEYFNEHHGDQIDLIGDMAAAWSKLIGYAPRFALLFHCIKQVADNGSLTSSVSADSMQKAITLVEWFKNEADRFYYSCGLTPRDRDLRRYAGWINQKYPDGITVREFQIGQRSITSADEARATLLEMQQKGLGEWDNSDPQKAVFRAYQLSTSTKVD